MVKEKDDVFNNWGVITVGIMIFLVLLGASFMISAQAKYDSANRVVLDCSIDGIGPAEVPFVIGDADDFVYRPTNIHCKADVPYKIIKDLN
jgi:hypothetical protein